MEKDAIFQALLQMFDRDNMPLKFMELADKIDSLMVKEQSDFFHDLIKATNQPTDLTDAGKVVQKLQQAQKDRNCQLLNRLRCTLGPWYSTVILADLCAIATEEVAPDRRRLQDRTQALAMEALAWVSDGIFSQVVLTIQGQEALGEATSEILFCSCVVNNALLEKLENFTNIYVKEFGTSSILKIHLRSNHRDLVCDKDGLPKIDNTEKNKSSECKTGCSHHKDKEGNAIENVLCLLPNYRLYVGKLKSLRSDLSAKDGSQGDFFKMAVKNGVFYEATKKHMFHIAAGIDYTDDAKQATATVAHLYVLREKTETESSFSPFPPQYEKTMEIMLHKLAHFHTLEKYVEEKRRLEKRDQMLELLVPRVEKLTTALWSTQRETQQIRAILNEPHEAIFTAQTLIAEYFTEGREIKNPNGSFTRVTHGLKQNKILDDEKWILAHILATMRGEELTQQSASSSLAHQIAVLRVAASDNSDVYHSLALSMKRLIDIKQTGHVDPVLALGRIKKRLFTPFKPEQASFAIEWGVIYAILPPDVGVSSSINTTDHCIPANINPFATQGHLLAFISGVVAGGLAGKNLSMTASLVQSNGNNVGLKFEGPAGSPWIDNINRLFNTMVNYIKIHNKGFFPHDGEYGDQTLPFMRLISKIPRNMLIGDPVKDDSSIIIYNRKVYGSSEYLMLKQEGQILSLRVNNLLIEIDGNKFSIVTASNGDIL